MRFLETSGAVIGLLTAGALKAERYPEFVTE